MPTTPTHLEPQPLSPASPLPAVVAALVASTLLFAPARPASADDRDLLRTQSGSAYVMIILDNSGSMALGMPGTAPPSGDPGPDCSRVPFDSPVPLNGDDPCSKFYTAKQVLYDVFKPETEISYGFASYDQGNTRVKNKHWLYTAPSAVSLGIGNSGVTFPFPAVGKNVNSQVLGAPFDPTTYLRPTPSVGNLNPGTKVATLGSCTDPFLPTSADLDRLARFPLLGPVGGLLPTNSNWTTNIYLRSGTGPQRIYLLTITRVSGPTTNNLRSVVTNAPSGVTVHIAMDANACATGGTNPLPLDVPMTFKGTFLYGESSGAALDTNGEKTAGFWTYSDIDVAPNCGNSHPFSGLGWEGNYDGTFAGSAPPTVGALGNSLPAESDAYQNCNGANRFNDSCLYNLKQPTTVDTRYTCPAPSTLPTRVLDSGDFIPFDWTNKHYDDFLGRLSPDGTGSNLGAADYFADLPDGTGYVPLLTRAQKPLIAAGPTTFNKAYIDFRCFFLAGAGGADKCRNNNNVFDDCNWLDADAAYDASAGCVKPYVITISDAQMTRCDSGENFCADVANMKKSGVQTWGIILNPTECHNPNGPSGIHCIDGPQGGGGEILCADDQADLKAALLQILGKIKTQATVFASAAVPTVQAAASQTVYVSDFTPIPPVNVGIDSFWDGHLRSFQKPLPIDSSGKPDTSVLCTSLAVDARGACLWWDAGAEMKFQIDSANPVGAASTQRRVFYSRFSRSGLWGPARRAFKGTTGTDILEPVRTIRYDLWNGLLGAGDTPPASTAYDLDDTTTSTRDAGAQGVANAVVTQEFALKSHTFIDSSTGVSRTVTNILGDIFHSDPLVLDNPRNTKYFAINQGSYLNALGAACTSSLTASTDHGYQCFALRHQYRRKLILVGSNDGILHAFDAGYAKKISDSKGIRIEYTQGTGKEVWGYIPRRVLPTVKTITRDIAKQEWSVDGSVAAADVLIDAAHTGTPTAADREWRTVAIAGLREGGRGYYALDLTVPDPLEDHITGTVHNIPKAVADTDTHVPGCLGTIEDIDAPTATTPSAACGTTQYPTPLWEFDDYATDATGVIADNATTHAPVEFFDEEVNSSSVAAANGRGDLGDTWSTPLIGRIQIEDGSGNKIDKYVAIFGGGEDKSSKTLPYPTAGNWLYMVDVETGRAIYKRQVLGSVPSQIAAVDTNQDGLLDRIYFGTSAGYFYRVDLGANPGGGGRLPVLETVSGIRGSNGGTYSANRLVHYAGDPTTSAWKPKILFTTRIDASGSGVAPRPIYYQPSVVFVARLGLYAVAFGTGDREDMWSPDLRTGRFYFFVDDSSDALGNPLAGFTEPYYNESKFQAVNSNSTVNTTTDYIFTRAAGQKGWYMVLDTNERVTTDAFALAGVASFSTFKPRVQVDDVNRNKLCTRLGSSRIFVVSATNGNGYFPGTVKAKTIGTFTTAPYSELGQNKNANPTTPTTNIDTLSVDQKALMESLKALFPRNCKFANYRIDIKTIAADTGVFLIAPVPICIVEKNWKEY